MASEAPVRAIRSAILRGPLDILHGVHPVDRQVQDDLLQVHRIDAHRQGPGDLIGLHRDALPCRLRSENMQRFLNHVVQVERLRLDIVLFLQESGEAP